MSVVYHSFCPECNNNTTFLLIHSAVFIFYCSNSRKKKKGSVLLFHLLYNLFGAIWMAMGIIFIRSESCKTIKI